MCESKSLNEHSLSDAYSAQNAGKGRAIQMEHASNSPNDSLSVARSGAKHGFKPMWRSIKTVGLTNF
jgi:hypothetical protein